MLLIFMSYLTKSKILLTPTSPRKPDTFTVSMCSPIDKLEGFQRHVNGT